MTPKEVLIATRHFYPNIKSPCLVALRQNELKDALDKNYKLIDSEIQVNCEKRFTERGCLLTIGKRQIKAIQGIYYDSLLNESFHDIRMALKQVFQCSTPDFLYALCEQTDKIKVYAQVQTIVDGFNWKYPYKVKLEVIE